MKAEEIRSRLRDVKGLATLPHVMTRIMAIITDEESSAKELAAEIRNDQALTAKILKIVNSAYYGFYRQISNIDEAVVILGFKEVRSISLAITVFGLFQERKNNYFDRRGFWKHSVITAVLADMLSEAFPQSYPEAFTAGLLHDLGYGVLDQYFPQEWQQICEETEKRQVHKLKVEREILGTDHAEIGFWVAEQWNFPPDLCQGIRYHHEPSRCEVAPQLAGIVHLSDILSRRELEAPPAPEMLPPLDSRVYEQVPVSRTQVDELFKKFAGKRDGVDALVNILAPEA